MQKIARKHITFVSLKILAYCLVLKLLSLSKYFFCWRKYFFIVVMDYGDYYSRYGGNVEYKIL